MAASIVSASPDTGDDTEPAVPLPAANRTAACAVVSVHSRSNKTGVHTSDALRSLLGRSTMLAPADSQLRSQSLATQMQTT